MPRLIQEVREHAKAVTCLYISPTGDKLYSGSLDKTIRVSHLYLVKIVLINIRSLQFKVQDWIIYKRVLVYRYGRLKPKRFIVSKFMT